MSLGQTFLSRSSFECKIQFCMMGWFLCNWSIHFFSIVHYIFEILQKYGQTTDDYCVSSSLLRKKSNWSLSCYFYDNLWALWAVFIPYKCSFPFFHSSQVFFLFSPLFIPSPSFPYLCHYVKKKAINRLLPHFGPHIKLRPLWGPTIEWRWRGGASL